ncbi:hypothetical protein QQX98_011889 [Neonectria punicea]|uniref:Right handed beta helix domain-containing protein n=1 Tax=Neonectria punicea TaxID=979145 RepID=A0ABR1GKN0_9HYPO
MGSDLKVIVAPGTYVLDEPLEFTADDSGFNGHRVIWEAKNFEKGVNISGGLRVQHWSLYDKKKGIYKAHVPRGFNSRHLYVDNKHAQRARGSLTRSWLRLTDEGYDIIDDRASFLLDLPDIHKAEIVGINSFTHRFSGIDGLGENNSLIMKQPVWANNIIGWDSMSNPFYDWGFFVENSLGLLNDDNEYYLDSDKGTVYYKPPDGKNANDMYTVFGRLEQLLVLSGTYDEPIHDLTFRGFHYQHTTWNLPSSDLGYADQQTGGFIGLNKTYPVNFEASRPEWFQIPGSIQVSAGHGVTFQNGSLTAVMGGFGIGNDENAHCSSIGLGASNIEISGMDFYQTGANAITLGGIQADAHHPSDKRMINKDNRILENTFREIAVHITSAAAIFVSYTQGTHIVHNDISDVPYSGICWGYGWGSNDAGGSPDYMERGLYDYQPVYDTPTIMKDGYIAKNLIRGYGRTHNDLGGIYTLSKSPNTTLTENWIQYGLPDMAAIYHDEGSRDYIDSNSVVDARTTNWFWRNEKPKQTTGNLTLYNFAVNQPVINGTNSWGDTVFNVKQWASYADLSMEQRSWVLESGIPRDQRSRRPTSTYPAFG